jgi:hypothetical protein
VERLVGVTDEAGSGEAAGEGLVELVCVSGAEEVSGVSVGFCAWGRAHASAARMSTVRMLINGFLYVEAMLMSCAYWPNNVFSTNSRLPPSNSKPMIEPTSFRRRSAAVSSIPTTKAGRLERKVIFPQLKMAESTQAECMCRKESSSIRNIPGATMAISKACSSEEGAALFRL